MDSVMQSNFVLGEHCLVLKDHLNAIRRLLKKLGNDQLELKYLYALKKLCNVPMEEKNTLVVWINILHVEYWTYAHFY